MLVPFFSFAPPSGPLLVSFSPVDISVMTLSESHGVCVHAIPGVDEGAVGLTEALPAKVHIFIRGKKKCQ